MTATKGFVTRHRDGTVKKVEMLPCQSCDGEESAFTRYAAGLGGVTIRVTTCLDCDHRTEEMIHEDDWDAALAPHGVVAE